MAADTTIAGVLDEIAQKIETIAGVDPAAAARDPEVVAKLARIRDSITDFATEVSTLALPDLTDVNSALSPNDRDLFVYDAGLSAWIADTLVLADLPAISLNDLSDAIITSPVDGAFLQYTTGFPGPGWVNRNNPLLNVIASDVFYAGLLTNHILKYSGGAWINGAINTVPALGNWDIGNWEFEARKLIAQNTTAAVSYDTLEVDQTVTDTGVVTANTLRGLFADINYTYNNGAGLCSETIIGLDLDLDLTLTAAAVNAPILKLVRGDMNYGAFAPTAPIVDINITGTASGATFGNAACLFKATSAANSFRALRSEAVGSSTGAGSTDVCAGYQGYGDGTNAYIGNVLGIHGFTARTHASCRGTWGILGQPDAFGSGIAADRKTAVGGYGGHFFINNGSMIVTQNSGGAVYDRPADIATTHLNFASNTGELYVENAAEFDGTAYFDGDFDHNGSNFGVFGVAPTGQASAYTQTYSTTTRTHANPTGAALTDSTGGTADQTVAAISGTGDDATLNNNFADLVDEVNKLITDVANVKQVLNSVIDDEQAFGFFG